MGSLYCKVTKKIRYNEKGQRMKTVGMDLFVWCWGVLMVLGVFCIIIWRDWLLQAFKKI